MNDETKFFIDNNKILNPSALLDVVKMSRINYAEALAASFDNELKFAKTADEVFDKFLYGKKDVRVKAREYYRDDHNVMCAKGFAKTIKAYTSNGTDKLLDIISLCGDYDCKKLDKYFSQMLNYALQKNSVYYTINKETTLADSLKVLDTDFAKVLDAYLRLPEQKQSKLGLIDFYKKYESVDNQYDLQENDFKELNYLNSTDAQIGDAGYKGFRKLFDFYKDQLTVKDIENLKPYISFRLRRMECVMGRFGNKALIEKANSIIEKYNKTKVLPKAQEVDEVINQLGTLGKDSYVSLSEKYKNELNKYLDVVRDIKDKCEVAVYNGEKVSKKSKSAVNDVYSALKTSKYMLKTDDKLKKQSERNDELCNLLLDIPVKRQSVSVM